jgi:hypothetical protein
MAPASLIFSLMRASLARSHTSKASANGRLFCCRTRGAAPPHWGRGSPSRSHRMRRCASAPHSRSERGRLSRVRRSCAACADAQWASGHYNGADLWRRLKVLGFRGSERVIREWTTRRRRAETPDAQSLQRVPSARTIARLMTDGRDALSKSETVTIAAIEKGVPLLVEAREIIIAFHAMIRKKTHVDLDPWLERACASLVACFANGITERQGRHQRCDYNILV